jgi:RNA polymerase primary sigma factor
VLSDRAVRLLARVRDTRRTYVQSQGRDATTDELSTECGLPSRQIEKLLAAERDPRAIDEPIAGDGGVMCTFGDQLADPQAEEEYDRLPWRLEEQHMLALLDGLTTREQAILHGRFGLGCPERTLRELADRFGVSAERVRQIEKRALERLRDAVDGEQGRPISARDSPTPTPGGSR